MAILFFSANSSAQHHKFGFQSLLKKAPNEVTTFCVPNDEVTKVLLNKEKIQVKYKTANWLFISTTASWIDAKTKSLELKNYYFEFAPPVALADSALAKHNVVQVHNGLGGLSSSYTGKDVVVGFVDQGIDWNHPDFQDANGNTRVLRYWDHSTNSGGTVPQPYNYGIVWDSAQINTVAGMGTGNANANGSNKGVAPDAKIVIVETNFNLSNWTLTIADACDYIFKVADTLGLPAVVNLSLGTYLGSHDGLDPAGEYIDSLLTAKEGRIVVCAAGNSGNQAKYHVTGNVDSDTSFVWIQNNSSANAAFGPNHIYFDLWSDQSDATFDFAFGADKPGPAYGFRGRTDFRPAQSSINTPIFDTIFNSNGNRIATIEIYTELVNGNYHMEAYYSNVDSTNYLFRFETKGSGKYDLWSGTWMGLNNLVTNIPSSIVMPSIGNYHMPDSLQTIVSSWACSDKVITVGNFRNRKSHIDNNNNVFVSPDPTLPGKLSPNSSKGPNRHNIQKPDISASGDISLSAAPLWLLTNPAYWAAVDSGGWHARNGGTSMASPVISGIAALYLEKCNKATFADFKADLIATAYSDNYTGSLPNYGYGNGKADALALMLLNEFTATLVVNDTICSNVPILINSSNLTPITDAIWIDGFEGYPYTPSISGDYAALAINQKGCTAETDTVTIEVLPAFPIDPIALNGNQLSTFTLSTNYQWTLNGVDIPGATSSTLAIAPPYGTYSCYTVNTNGCVSETEPIVIVLGLTEVNSSKISIFPNPTSDLFKIKSDEQIKSVKLYNNSGKQLSINQIDSDSYSISSLPSGIYHVIIELESEKIYAKITRM
jgi:subtilisin family serine protease